jgi:chromosome segregation ATPase
MSDEGVADLEGPEGKETIVELLDQIARRNARIAQLRGQVERHDEEIEAERKKVAELSATLAEAEAVLARTQSKLEEKEALYETVRGQLDEIRASSGYRALQRYRATMAKLAPPNSIRRRIYRALTKPLRRARG